MKFSFVAVVVFFSKFIPGVSISMVYSVFKLIYPYSRVLLEKLPQINLIDYNI